MEMECRKILTKYLEALAVDNGWAALVIFLLGDPHLLEGGEGSEDGSSDPDRVLSLWWSNDLDLHCAWGKGGDLLLHSVGDSWVHGGSSGKNSVGIQVLSDINVALHDGVVGGLMDTARLHSQEGWLEEGLWASESLVSDGDDLTVGKLVALLKGAGRGSGSHLLLKVKSNVAELLLDVTNNLTLGGGGEGVASLGKDLHQVVSEVTTGKIQSEDGVGESVSLVDGDGVGDTITGIKDDTSGSSRGVEGKDSLDGDIHSWGVEGLEHDLGHLFSVGLGVQWGLGQEDWVLFGGNTKLIVEGVMPDLLHVIPVGNNTVLNWVLQGEDTSLGLGFISNIGVLLSHTDHDTLMSWSSNNGWEDSSWSIISSESSFAHTGSVINNESSNIFVTHFD